MKDSLNNLSVNQIQKWEQKSILLKHQEMKEQAWLNEA